MEIKEMLDSVENCPDCKGLIFDIYGTPCKHCDGLGIVRTK